MFGKDGVFGTHSGVTARRRVVGALDRLVSRSLSKCTPDLSKSRSWWGQAWATSVDLVLDPIIAPGNEDEKTMENMLFMLDELKSLFTRRPC